MTALDLDQGGRTRYAHPWLNENPRLRQAVDGTAKKHAEFQLSRLQPLGEAFLAALERDQRRLLRLCSALEKVADGLPRSRDSAKTSRVLSILNAAFQRHMLLHEKCLFPLIRSLAGSSASIEPVLAQLQFEHASDHGLVLEIISAFLNSREAQPGTHALGYLLRSFFENYRRHHAWESRILYPVARQYLTGRGVTAQHDALLRVSLGLGV
ncbi:MAG: hemerythrin domain-containing protein [Rhodomicrobium sp.]